MNLAPKAPRVMFMCLVGRDNYPHKIRCWRAVSAAGLQGKCLRKRSAFFTGSGMNYVISLLSFHLSVFSKTSLSVRSPKMKDRVDLFFWSFCAQSSRTIVRLTRSTHLGFDADRDVPLKIGSTRTFIFFMERPRRSCAGRPGCRCTPNNHSISNRNT